MDKHIFRNFNNTIGYLIFKKILISYIIFASLLTSYQIYSELNTSVNRMGKDFYQVFKHFNKRLTYGVWFKDKNNLKNILNEMMQEQNDIKGISLVSKNEVIILRGLVDEKLKEKYKEKGKNENFVYSISPLISFEHQLYNYIDNTDEKMGTLTFYTTKQMVFDYTKETIFLIIFNILLSMLLFWGLTVYATHKYLTMPLKELIDGIKSFESHDDEKVAIKLDLKNMRELTILAKSFNKMSSKISEDIINLKQLTMIQNQQKKALEEANKTKDDFLANMSHELKTPLNSINLISSIMMKNKSDKFDEKDIKNLKIINNCGNDLLFLINDILDLSKLEAGKMKLNYELIDMESFIQKINDMFYPQAKEKGIRLTTKIDESLKEIYTDESRLNQVLKNLIGNSIKFVHEGEIRLIVQEKEETIQIVVSDDGIGISEDKLEHIFDRFKQADGSTTRKYGGTGLGLAICKDLISLFNGSINIESKVNIGTTITIEIPKNLDMISSERKVKKVENSSELEDLDHEFLFDMEDEKEDNQTKDKSKILVLNSDPISYMSLIIEFNKNFQTQQINNISDMFKKLREEEFDLIVIDNESLEESNIEKILNLEVKYLIATKDSEQINERIKEKSKGILHKPFDNNLAVETIKEILA
ncbi:sensor histidine kinase [Arcobacter arenosus]|uniref:sensor histidine kinase n=1 Tax=Arcobacter arenosus TaxID=2576037 RepID=UPI003BA96327